MPERILIIDDDEFMRDSIKIELESAGYLVSTASDGFKAIELSKDENFDLIICDVRMPGINGLETLSAIKEYQPVARNIIITGYASPETPVNALKMKVDDYLMKPFTSEEFLKSVRSALLHYQQTNSRDVSSIRFRENFLRLITGIFFESRISYLVGHSERVARICYKMATEMKFSLQRTQNLYLAALLHDIGYIELPPHLLEKKDFESKDYDLIKNHPILARDLLSPFNEMKDISTIIFHHHERWDGKGYPVSLAGEQIPLESRIIAVAEAYDSLISERPHRQKRDINEAVNHLRNESGIAFDPDLLDVIDRVVKIYDKDEIEIPMKLSERQTGKAAFLLNLGDVYREFGNLDVASRAYEEAESILSDEEPPEIIQRLNMGKIMLLSNKGMFNEALEIAIAAKAAAEKKSLQFILAQVDLSIAYLKIKLGLNIEAKKLLKASRETFVVWESLYNVCEADFLSASLYAGNENDYNDFSVCYGSFLKLVESGNFYDVIIKYRDIAFSVIKYAIEKECFLDSTSRLFRENDVISFELLERLMETDNIDLKLRVMDILKKFNDRRMLGLLTKSRKDENEAVSQKSISLIESAQEVKTKPVLQINFFGKFRVCVDNEPISDENWLTRKTRSVFAYMSSRRGEVESEEKLMDLFWLQGGDKARHSLHNSISSIRKIFHPYLGSDAKRLIIKKIDGYSFSQKIDCVIDLEEFNLFYHKGKILAEQSQWQEALIELQKAERIYSGEFMEASYDEWSDDLRLKSKNKLLELLNILGKYFYNKKKYEVSIDYWRKILSNDNCFEDAYLGMILCYLYLDNQSEAIKAYHKCIQTLKKELDLAPPPRIIEIYLKIVHGEKIDDKYRFLA